MIKKLEKELEKVLRLQSWTNQCWKSSLLNHLSNRDVAIVSEIAGTTRDVIETHLKY